MVNVGSLDRILRFIVGGLLLVAPVLLADVFAPLGAWRFVIAVMGAVMLATAVFRFCPAYTLFGIRTCESSKN
jgi:hypothetical protein